MTRLGLHPRSRRHRAGTTYVLVLVVTSMVVLIGLSAMTVNRIHVRSWSRESTGAGAARLARSGIEHALQWIDTTDAAAQVGNQEWRETTTARVTSGPHTLGDGTFSWEISDPVDDDLRDDPSESVLVVATGTIDDVSQQLAVRLEPAPGTIGLASLETGFHVEGDSSITDGLMVGDAVLSIDGNLTAGGGADVNLAVEATGTISGGSYNRATTQGVSDRAVPDPATVFDYYLARGTWIDIDDIAHVGSADNHGDLQDLVLSPTSNPLGTPNPEGIYIVDCKGRHLKIKNSRIIGTIVVVNPDPDPAKATRIEKSLNWQAAVPNYPVLLVDGGVTFKMDSAPLSEATRSTNFNPPGTPYQGSTDSDQTDTFPNVVGGLVYANGPVTVDKPKDPGMSRVDGAIVGNGPLIMNAQSQIMVLYDSLWFDNPPPGFAVPNGPLRVVPGSWHRP